MYLPLSHPWVKNETLVNHLERRGVSRRQFLKYCGELAVLLGLGEAMAPRVAKALEAQRRPSVIWLQLQECTGCVESVLRTSDPVPLEENGMYLMIGGRTGREVLEEAAAGAGAVKAVGACAYFGSVQAARPNPTGAVGVADIVRDKPVVTISGCPPIADVVTATVVHYLTFNRFPELDGEGRPLFAYGKRIHDQCSRRAHFDAGQYVQAFDDEGARKGWCLYGMGCKGPATFSPCPVIQWNSHTSWPIGAGHPCLGCTERNFWDVMTPFYGRLPDVGGFGVESNADIIGLSLALGATAGVAAHAIATGIHRARTGQTPHQPAVDLPVAKPQQDQSEEEPHD
ncbi:MAG: hydrogenase small subunit [Gemmatimonadota bacterium]